MSSGISALVCALLLGKRRGYGKEPMPPHNLPLVVLGACLLWFGWFGFNAGSALAANGLAVSAFVATNTAAASAALCWMAIEGIINGKPTLLGGATGAVAGLATVTPAAGFISPISALIIGVLASIVCYLAVAIIKLKLAYDDSLDAFGVHGIGGTIGVLSTGLLAQKLINPAGANGLFFGNPNQFIIQLYGVLATIVYCVTVTFILLKIIDKFIGLRVSEEEEVVGLDITQHEESAYTLLD
jgi:Amt family ammonium transporter